MSVYLDDLRKTPKTKAWPYHSACHLWSASEEELERFARRLNLLMSWRHGDHYDITRHRRIVAVELGAIQITTRELVELRRKARKP